MNRINRLDGSPVYLQMSGALPCQKRQRKRNGRGPSGPRHAIRAACALEPEPAKARISMHVLFIRSLDLA